VPSSLRFDPEWRLTLFAVLLVPLMAGLGFWQLERAEEKAQLAAGWEARQQQAPTALSELVGADATTLPYHRVRLLGQFSPDQYFLVDNKINRGRFGYEVLSVFQWGGGYALVNRGWIPGDSARLSLPEVPAVTGEVEVTGHIYVSPGSPYLLAEQRLEDGWPKRIQAVEMQKLTPAIKGETFPYPIRLDAGQPGALVAEWTVVNMSPEKHQGYALQWLTMAAVLLIIYLLRSSNLLQLIRDRRADEV